MYALPKALAVLAGVPFLLSNSDPRINDGMPPARFHGEAVSIVLFVNDVTTICGKAPVGYTKLGCQFERNKVPYIVVPNPCVIGDHDFYAKLLCHEKAHVHGWTGDHEE